MKTHYNYAVGAVVMMSTIWVILQPGDAFKKDGFAGLFDLDDDDDEDDDDYEYDNTARTRGER